MQDREVVIPKNTGDAAWAEENRQKKEGTIYVGYRTAGTSTIWSSAGSQRYITWGFIEDYIITNSLGFLSNSSNNKMTQQDVYDAAWESLQAKKMQSGEFATREACYEWIVTSGGPPKGAVLSPLKFDLIFPKFNSYSTKIFNDPALISGDPNICVLPKHNSVLKLTTKEKNDESDNNATAMDYGAPTFITNSTQIEEIAPPVDFPDFDDPNNSKLGYVRNICVNLEAVKKAFEDTKTLSDFVMNLLNQISEACGNAWKFGLFVDEKNANTISVVDLNTWATEDIKDFEMVVYGVNSIAREASITTEVDANIKGSIMYGTNKQSGTNDIGEKNTIEYQFYGRQVRDITHDNLYQSDISYDISDKLETEDNKTKNTTQELLSALVDSGKRVYTNATDETTREAKQAINNYLVRTYGGQFKSDGSEATSTNVILPVKLNFTLDGLSGIKFGNVLRASPLPKRYTDAVKFSVTNVTHNLTNNDWTTAIETVMRVSIPIDNSGLGNASMLTTPNQNTSAGNNTTTQDITMINPTLTLNLDENNIIKRYVKNHFNYAKSAAPDWDPFIILAHSAVEQGYAYPHLRKFHNGYFAITCGKNWKGNYHLRTSDKYKFRGYVSPKESFEDYISLIKNNYNGTRYNHVYDDKTTKVNAFQYRKNAQKYANEIENSPYCEKARENNYAATFMIKYNEIYKAAKELNYV